MLTSRVTCHAIATACRNAWFHVRNGCMAEGAITTMGDIDRRIRGHPRIMTACAGGAEEVLNATDRHIPGSNMVCVCHRSIGMTIQTVGRVGSQRYGVNELLPRAVVTGGAGAGSVGGHIVFSVNCSPVRRGMTAPAGRAARQVSGT